MIVENGQHVIGLPAILMPAEAETDACAETCGDQDRHVPRRLGLRSDPGSTAACRVYPRADISSEDTAPWRSERSILLDVPSTGSPATCLSLHASGDPLTRGIARQTADVCAARPD